MNPHYLALFVGIALTGISQVLLRLGAAGRSSWLRSYLHGLTMIGYAVFVVVTAINVYVLTAMPLKTFTAWISLTFVWTAVLSRFVLKEEIHSRVYYGVCIIVVGILIFVSGGGG